MMRTTRMGSARGTGNVQAQASHSQVLPADDEIGTRRELTHAQLLVQSDDHHASNIFHEGGERPQETHGYQPRPLQIAEPFQPLQRPHVHSVSSQSGAAPTVQQSAVGMMPASASAQLNPTYLSLLSMQTNSSHPKSSPMQAQQEQIQNPASKHLLSTGPLVGKPHGILYGSVPKSAKDHEDAGFRERVEDNALVVSICDRKVRLSSDLDSSSLYSLCRRWVRNDVSRKDQMKSSHNMIPIPKPLPRVAMGSKQNELQTNYCEDELQVHTNTLNEAELLQHHVEKYKNVRKRAREQRLDRIARFKPRLCLLFPSV